MTTQKINFVDSCGCVLATAQVTARDGLFSGLADLSNMPGSLRRKFEEYEEIVLGQMFGSLDSIEDQIQDLSIKVVFENDAEAAVEDLQLYPSSGRVSFKVPQIVPRKEKMTAEG